MAALTVKIMELFNGRWLSLYLSLRAITWQEGTRDAQQSNEITFQKPEPLEKVCANKGVTEIEQKSAEEHPFAVDVDGVGAGANVAHSHLKQKGKRKEALLWQKMLK